MPRTLLFALPFVCALPASANQERISRPGIYAGYSPLLYDEWVRSSQYVAVRDGTRLAVDVYRPSAGGKAVEKRYPVIWQFTPYRRAYFATDGKMVIAARDLLTLTNYGYVVAVADVRGKGASFGRRRGFQDRTEAWDGYDINEWLARQPWSDGNVGMTGCSYLGGSAKNTATTAPPHLKAVVVGCSDFDRYDMVSANGITGQFNTRPESALAAMKDDLASVPVDEDEDGSLLRKAVGEHAANTPMDGLWRDMPFRDSTSRHVGTKFWSESSFSSYLDVLRKSRIAVYHWGNWQDEESEGTIIGYVNLPERGKLWVGGWGHCQSGGFDWIVEQHRWFDYWLKGIDNGIMKEPPVYYYTMDAAKGTEWQSASKWPVPGMRTNYYFGQAGSLGLESPSVQEGKDTFSVDYSARCRKPAPFLFWPCILDDERLLTYTSSALNSDLQITGHPEVHLWVSSTNLDGDFFVNVEDVGPDGSVQITNTGRLKASHRALHTPPFNYLGLPWHRSYEEDVLDLVPEGPPVELNFALWPTSKVFRAGHRIRVTIFGADPRQRVREQFVPPPVVTIHRDAVHMSYLTLPVAKRQD
jgi:putative CocE/NonD family hydrolase